MNVSLQDGRTNEKHDKQYDAVYQALRSSISKANATSLVEPIENVQCPLQHDWQLRGYFHGGYSCTVAWFHGHCTYWDSGDIHCKMNSQPTRNKCGYFHGHCECTKWEAYEAYSDFSGDQSCRPPESSSEV